MIIRFSAFFGTPGLFPELKAVPHRPVLRKNDRVHGLKSYFVPFS